MDAGGKVKDGNELAKRAIEQGVVFVPGALFVAKNLDVSSLRLSFCYGWGGQDPRRGEEVGEGNLTIRWKGFDWLWLKRGALSTPPTLCVECRRGRPEVAINSYSIDGFRLVVVT